MAAMAAEKPPATAPPQERLGVPSRNPLPLSASQEAQVRDIYYARVRNLCADEIKGEPLPTIGTSWAGCVASHRPSPVTKCDALY
jgi:COX assembly protein 1